MHICKLKMLDLFFENKALEPACNCNRFVSGTLSMVAPNYPDLARETSKVILLCKLFDVRAWTDICTCQLVD